jgi:hypothetical protein
VDHCINVAVFFNLASFIRLDAEAMEKTTRRFSAFIKIAPDRDVRGQRHEGEAQPACRRSLADQPAMMPAFPGFPSSAPIRVDPWLKIPVPRASQPQAI